MKTKYAVLDKNGEFIPGDAWPGYNDWGRTPIFENRTGAQRFKDAIYSQEHRAAEVKELQPEIFEVNFSK